jgi:probable F420-dependent oxidoreductase
MLELAAEKSDGALAYLVPVEHTRRARELLGPGKLFAPEQFVLLEKDPVKARESGRAAISWYLAVPDYNANLRNLGFGDDDLALGHPSDRLVDALVAWGDEEAVQARVRAHLEAGADHVCIQPIPRGEGDLGLEQLRQLAPAFLDL